MIAHLFVFEGGSNIAISKYAVQNFLNQKLENWDWLKDLGKERLKEEFNYHIENYLIKKFHPYEHQMVSILLGYWNPQFLFFLDMGLGKSRCLIDIINIRKQEDYVHKTLVLVPNVVMVSNWGDEIETHSNLSWIGLTGTVKDRLDNLDQDKDIYVMNYQGLQSLLTSLEYVIDKKGKKSKKRKRVIDKNKAIEFSKKFGMIIYDEIHKCKNRKSLTYQLCLILSKYIKYRYGLTGTPMGRDPIDLWTQFMLIDEGETLGRNITMYREAYFNQRIEEVGWDKIKKQKRKVFTYSFKKKLESDLYERLKNKSIRYSEDEANELPDKVYIIKKLLSAKEAGEYYEKAKQSFIEMMQNKHEVTEMKNNFMKMRQITSGFIYLKDEETGEGLDIEFDENPKLDMLEELILDIPETSKVVIFHEFRKSGELISDRLKQIGIKHVRLDGSIKDKEGARDKFINDKTCRAFVVNSQSGGIGLNLQIANYVIFFESPVSPIIRKQAEKRCHRTGTTKKVFFYDLVIKDSIGERILEFLEEGKDIFDALMEGRKKGEQGFNISEILMPGISEALKKGICYETL